MSDAKFGEPWAAYAITGIETEDGIALGGLNTRYYDPNLGYVIQKWRRDRILACVNAMAGIEDPEKFRQDATELAGRVRVLVGKIEEMSKDQEAEAKS